MASYGYRNSLDPSSGWSNRLSGSEHFPSPFFDMASLAMPNDNRNALQWCEFIFNSQDTYRMAMERVISYFLTDLEISSANKQKVLGDDEKTKWESFLNEDIGILGFIQDLDRDRVTYGNGFASVIVPIRRYMECRRCHYIAPFREIHDNKRFKFRFTPDYRFTARCVKCDYAGEWNIMDKPNKDPREIILRRWSPHDIHILHDPFTLRNEYLWRIPERDKRLIRSGEPFVLESTPIGVLEAIRANKMFKFDKGAVYHMKEPTLAGMNNMGWGISRIITSFRQIWYVQVLHRYNEAIALDYVIPFRLITPAARGGSNAARGQAVDPLLMMDMGDFMGQVRSMVRKRRQDPAGWHTLPFPVDYQALGGDAQSLAPRELLDQGLETLLNASGTPAQMYRGDMAMQVAPVAMRLFEATWHHLVHDNNAFLRWAVERISKLLSWEMVRAEHKRVTHADDVQLQTAMLQLMMGGTISQTTGLKSLNIDWKAEMRRIQEEARYTQEQTAEVQEEMDTSAFGQQVAQGQPPGGQPGMPMSPGGGGMPQGGGAMPPVPGMPGMGPVSSMVQNNMMPQTPEEMLASAEQLAQELLGIPEAQKDSELRALKQKNEVLHSLVRSKLDQIRSQARSQGGMQILSGEFGAG